MPKKILWIGQSEPMPEQRADIERLFPGASIELDTRKAQSTEDIISRIRAGRYDETVAVVSWSILSQLTQRGIFPLYAKVARKHGQLVHVGIFRCEGVDIRLSPACPA